MARPPVSVRDATSDDVQELVEMWGELRVLAGRLDRGGAAPTEAGVLRRLHDVADDPDRRLVVATLGGEIVGTALLSHEPVAALADVGAVHVHYLHVRPAHRRRGIGGALLAAAVSFAEECGAEHVVANVSSQLREAQRFYARLGFGPVVVRRVAPVSVLRRRLTAERASRGRAPVDELSARRRTARARMRAALARVAID